MVDGKEYRGVQGPSCKRTFLSPKLRRWARIGAYPSAYPNYSATTVRRNYARLYAQHESL